MTAKKLKPTVDIWIYRIERLLNTNAFYKQKQIEVIYKRQGTLTEREGSVPMTIDLLIRVACFATNVKSIFCVKRS